MKWKYKFELNIGEPGPGEVAGREEEELNMFGREGWELVAVSRCGKDFSYLGFWFKRPVSK